MSVGEQALERSVLERKDRDELLAIVEAIGEKAPSRARKAELVDLILATAGVSAAPAATGADDTATGEVAAAEEPEVASNGGRGRRAKAAPVDEAPAAGPPAADAVAVAAVVEAEAGGAAEALAGEATGGAADELAGEQVPSPGDAAAGGPDGGHAEGEGLGPDGIQTVVGEAGNRRGRRRRGRGGGGQQQPQQREEVWSGEPVEVEGLLDLRDDGYGFIRTNRYLPNPRDVYVSVKQVRQFGLRKGDQVKGTSRPAARDEKNPALLRIDEVSGLSPDDAMKRPRFEDLTPLFPDEKLKLELPDDPLNMTARIIDLICPIGKGQRGLIVSPPKAGKTTIMKQIVHSIERNNPEVHLMVLLVDERPEEVTDMRRSTQGEVVASTFDRPAEEHTMVTELAIERAKRLVEGGRDVVIILDGITRLARAYNLAAPATGRIMSGGVDSGALYPPKKFFGAARNLEEGGSLTIIATALIETGSKMDEVIFEEFKGTGNMELRLDRRMSERRIYPAIDVDASSTRHEELLFDRKQLQQVWKLRRVLSGLHTDGGSGGAGLELLIDRMKSFRSNDEFLAKVAEAAPGA